MGMDKQMEGQMEGWTNGHTNKRKNIYSIFRDKLSLPEGSLDNIAVGAYDRASPIEPATVTHLPRLIHLKVYKE
jgi:hypothetical protein